MNIFLNEKLAQMPIMYIDVLLTPKRKPTLPLTSTLFCFVSNIAVCIFVYKGCKQSNFFTTTIKGELKHIYNCEICMCVTYLHIQDIQYDSITLSKGKISYKLLVWNQTSLLLKELVIFIFNLI